MSFKVAALCITLGLVFGVMPLRADSGAVKEWKSDPNYASSLAAEQPLGPFAIQLPAGFTVAYTKKTDKFVAIRWSGPERSAGVHAFILISMGSDTGVITPDSPFYAGGAKELFSTFKGAFAKTYVNYVQSPMKRGTVNGMTAERAYFKGQVVSGGEPLDAHGMYYLVDTGNFTAFVMAADTEPFTKITLPLLEASCLSIRSNDTPSTNPNASASPSSSAANP